ncbi:hypothetical protein STEG23_026433, partial [Scotinomys teguina]
VISSATMEYYAAEKNNDIMKFAGKWMELENVILSEFKRICKTKQNTIQMRICKLGHEMSNKDSRCNFELYLQMSENVLFIRLSV